MFPFQDNILKKSSLICLPEGQITSDPDKGSQNIKRPCRHFPPPLLVPSTVQQWPPVCLSAVQTLPLPSRAPANTAALRLLNNNIDFFGNTRLPAGFFGKWLPRTSAVCQSQRVEQSRSRERCAEQRETRSRTQHMCCHTSTAAAPHTSLSHLCGSEQTLRPLSTTPIWSPIDLDGTQQCHCCGKYATTGTWS